MQKNRVLVTGAAGFIGSQLAHRLWQQGEELVLIDNYSYGREDNLIFDDHDFRSEVMKLDIRDKEGIENIFKGGDIDYVYNIAGIAPLPDNQLNPQEAIEVNVVGFVNLLENARINNMKKVIQASTNAMYENETEFPTSEANFKVPTLIYPNTKYAAERFAQSYCDTYGMNVTISNCSNNYGPYQFPEKLIPLVINNIQEGKEIPIYGKGDNIRDWLYVDDHIDAIDLIFHKGKSGESSCIGGNCEKTNIEIIDSLIISYVNLYDKRHELTYEESHNSINYLKSLKKFVSDRKGHDFRYAIDYSKIKNELGWEPKVSFKEGIDKTVGWYIDHYQWVQNCIDGSYRDYYEKIYKNR